jgi:hypothetical protein
MTNAEAPSNADGVPSGGQPAGTSGEQPTASTTSLRSWHAPGWGVVVVVLVLAIFVAFAAWAAIGTSSEEWARRALIFGAIEALAATALGWYFGSAIQSERVAHAEAQARQAARDAENGRALAALVLAREGRVVENDAGSTLTGTTLTDDQKVRREYADAARQLFPYALGRTKPTDKLDTLETD